MKIHFIRHGMTPGNERHAWIGRTDQPLSEAGAAAVRQVTAPPCTVLAVSPMLRCRQTAQILYPDMEQMVVEDLRETDFGLFEEKNAEDLEGDPLWRKWIDSGGRDPFPGGDDPEQFRIRCCGAFERLTAGLAETETLSIVAHGGTIMSILSYYALPPEGFYDRVIPNAGGYSAQWDGLRLTDLEKI